MAISYISNSDCVTLASALNNDLTASELSASNNNLAHKLMKRGGIGQESPLAWISKDGLAITQRGKFKSVAWLNSFLANRGCSGATMQSMDYVEYPETDMQLRATTTIMRIPSTLSPAEKAASIQKRLTILVKEGSEVGYDEAFLKVDNQERAWYRKGENYRATITGEPVVSINWNGTATEATSALVTVTVPGYQWLPNGTQVDKDAADGWKATAMGVINPKTIADLSYGGMMMLELAGTLEETVTSFFANKFNRVPASIMIGNPENEKGAHVTINSAACHFKATTGKSFGVQETEYQDGDHTNYWMAMSNEQTNLVNAYNKYQCKTVIAVGEFNKRWWDRYQTQHADNTDIMFVEVNEKYYVFHKTEVRFSILHSTTELSSTVENKSKQSGKLYLEALAAVYDINPLLGDILWATGKKQRDGMNLMLQCLGKKALEVVPTIWDRETVLPAFDGNLFKLFKKLPNIVQINDADGGTHLISFEIGSILGMTPEGGVTSYAKALGDIAAHMEVPLDDRNDGFWVNSLKALACSANAALRIELCGGKSKLDESSMVKTCTKSGNVTWGAKVRCFTAPFIEENTVYLASHDAWASKLKGKTLMVFRNPIQSFVACRVVIVGPAIAGVCEPNGTDDKDFVVTEKQCLSADVVYLDPYTWFSNNMGDDDGDHIFFFVIDDLLDWACTPYGRKCMLSEGNELNKLMEKKMLEESFVGLVKAETPEEIPV